MGASSSTARRRHGLGARRAVLLLFHWKVPSEIGFEIVRQLYRQGFDPAYSSTAKIDYAIGIPLTHLGHTDPVLPIYVNAYLPPQPTMERCYQFGQAIAFGVSTCLPRPGTGGRREGS